MKLLPCLCACLLLPLVASAQEPGLLPQAAPAKEDVDTWDELKLKQNEIKARLLSILHSGNNEAGNRLAAALAVPQNDVGFTVNYPNAPYLVVQFQRSQTNSPALDQLARHFVNDVLSEDYFSPKFIKDTKTQHPGILDENNALTAAGLQIVTIPPEKVTRQDKLNQALSKGRFDRNEPQTRGRDRNWRSTRPERRDARRSRAIARQTAG